MKKIRMTLLCLLLVLAARPAMAEDMTGELVIDGIAFTMDFALPEEVPAEVSGYTAQARVWGGEPKERFDAALFIPELAEAENKDSGFDGQRMYIIGEYGHDPFETLESLRFDHQQLSVEYANNFGANVREDRAGGFLYRPGQGELAERFHAELPRYWRPAPGEVEDLEGLKYQDALAVLAPYLAASGLDTGEPYYVEAWSRELARENVAVGTPGEPTPYERERWADAPAYYSIHLPVRIAGLLTQRHLHTGETYDEAHKTQAPLDIHAIVSERGLEYLVMRPYLEDPVPTEAARPMLPARQALDLLAVAGGFWEGGEIFYDGDTLERTLTIIEMAPAFVVRYTLPMDNSYELVPVWEFLVRIDALEDWGDGEILRNHRMETFAIHAVTGERIE